MLLWLSIYVLTGILVLFLVLLYALDRRKENLTEGILEMGFSLVDPYLWLLFLIWPIGVPVWLWKSRKEPSTPIVVVPTQVSNEMVGRVGEVTRELRPVGEVVFDDKRHEATCQHGIVPVGETVVVKSQDSLRLVVARMGEDLSS